MAFNFDTWPTMEQFSAIHDQPIASQANGYKSLSAEVVVNKTKFVDELKFFKKMQDDKLLIVVKTKQLGMDPIPAFASQACQIAMSSIAATAPSARRLPKA